MAGKQQKPCEAKYRVHGSVYKLRKELEALVIFAGTYEGLMKESLYHRMKALNSMLND